MNSDDDGRIPAASFMSAPDQNQLSEIGNGDFALLTPAYHTATVESRGVI